METRYYKEEQYRQKMYAGTFGCILSIGINAAIILSCSFSGLKYIYPPPEEKTILIEFEQQDAPKIRIRKTGTVPSAEDAEKNKKIELVQKSQAQLKGTKQNLAKASTTGPDGDVDVNEPPREEPIDNRALFHSAQNTDKDTLAAQTAREVSDALKAGHPKGNADAARITGAPTANVVGRNIVGIAAKPSYTVQKEGTVVVEIWVDRMGEVVRATPGIEGTTVTDKELWNAARQAVLKTRFNANPEAPGLQRGTMTYIFKLK